MSIPPVVSYFIGVLLIFFNLMYKSAQLEHEE
ncbi:MAG: hypothetical protein ACJASU_000200 [Cognaticolwellia sp.]|jgi:hypothetical protein